MKEPGGMLVSFMPVLLVTPRGGGDGLYPVPKRSGTNQSKECVDGECPTMVSQRQ